MYSCYPHAKYRVYVGAPINSSEKADIKTAGKKFQRLVQSPQRIPADDATIQKLHIDDRQCFPEKSFFLDEIKQYGNFVNG